MNTKFARTRQFVNDNQLTLAFCAGSITTSAILALLNKDVTLLRVSKENLALMKQGGAIVYELKDTTLHLVNIPAVEAAQAAL